jgi:hypothetical protein
VRVPIVVTDDSPSLFSISQRRARYQIDSGGSSSTCSTVPEGAFVHLDLAQDLGDRRDDSVTIFKPRH